MNENYPKKRKRDVAHLWADKRAMRFFRKNFPKTHYKNLRSVYLALCEIDSDFREAAEIYGFTKTVATYTGMNIDTIRPYLQALKKATIIEYEQQHIEGKFSGTSLSLYIWDELKENWMKDQINTILQSNNKMKRTKTTKEQYLSKIPLTGKPVNGETSPFKNNNKLLNINKNSKEHFFLDSQNNKKDKESFIIYKYWIKKASHISKAQYTQNLEKKIKSKLSKLKWQRNTILQGINNYIKIHDDPKFYYQHSFTLHSFIEQGNGIPRFVEGLDEKYNGDIWQNYCREIKQENKLFTNEIPVQTQIQNYFDNDVLIKAFQNKCLAPAADLFSNISESEITSALLKLHDQIDKKQNKNLSANTRSLLPSPFDLLIGYIDWITKNDWITNLTINMIDSTHSLFLKYCRETAAADNLERDPITGKSYIRT